MTTLTHPETKSSATPATKNSAEQNALMFEYSSAADPVSSGSVPPIPYAEFAADLYSAGPTRIIPLDLSQALEVCLASQHAIARRQLSAHRGRRHAGDLRQLHLGVVLCHPRQRRIHRRR